MTTTTKTTRRESLKTRLRKINNGTPGNWWALVGCPVGGWGETAQVRSRIAEDLPLRTERSYTVDELITALYEVDHAERYQAR